MTFSAQTFHIYRTEKENLSRAQWIIQSVPSITNKVCRKRSSNEKVYIQTSTHEQFFPLPSDAA